MLSIASTLDSHVRPRRVWLWQSLRCHGRGFADSAPATRISEVDAELVPLKEAIESSRRLGLGRHRKSRPTGRA
jgi:hypothetical protein